MSPGLHLQPGGPIAASGAPEGDDIGRHIIRRLVVQIALAGEVLKGHHSIRIEIHRAGAVLAGAGEVLGQHGIRTKSKWGWACSAAINSGTSWACGLPSRYLAQAC